MKAFTYERVENPAEAIAAVVRTPGAKFIAGGTNLLDLMKLQIETPTHLVDVKGRNTTIIDRFCRGLSLCPRHHWYRVGAEEFIAYCFADKADAQFFQMHFGGELVTPETRPRSP